MQNMDDYKTWCIQLCVHVKYTLNTHVIIILCGKKSRKPSVIEYYSTRLRVTPASPFGRNRLWYENPSPRRRRRLTRIYGHSRIIQRRSVYNNKLRFPKMCAHILIIDILVLDSQYTCDCNAKSNINI